MDSATLKRRRKRAAAGIPPLEEIVRGSLFLRRRRCGQLGCHCAKEKGHASYYLSVNRVGRSPLQLSLPPELVPTVRAWVANYHHLWKVMEEISGINRTWIRSERQWRKGIKSRRDD